MDKEPPWPFLGSQPCVAHEAAAKDGNQEPKAHRPVAFPSLVDAGFLIHNLEVSCLPDLLSTCEFSVRLLAGELTALSIPQ